MVDPTFTKTIQIANTEECDFIAEDFPDNAVYQLVLNDDSYTVSKINLETPNDPIKELFTRRIEMDNCGDGPTAFDLLDTPAGKILQVSELGSDVHYSRYAYDLTLRKIVFEKQTSKDITINPASKFYQEFISDRT